MTALPSLASISRELRAVADELPDVVDVITLAGLSARVGRVAADLDAFVAELGGERERAS